MFTKQQRQVLNDLSLELYGVSSRWQKVFKDPSFRIPTEQRTEEGATQYVRLSNRKSGGGTVMKRETALRLGKIKEDELPPKGRIIVDGREPSFDEFVTTLKESIEVAKISVLSGDKLTQVLAQRYTTDRLPGRVDLITQADPQYTADVDALLKVLDEEKVKYLKSMQCTAQQRHGGVPVDALQFVSDVVFATNHPAEAAELVAESFGGVVLHPPVRKSFLAEKKTDLPAGSPA